MPHFNSLKTPKVVKSRPGLICREFTSTTVWQETQTSERWFSELQLYSAFPIRSAQDSRHGLSESSSSDLAETFSICMFFCVPSLSFYSKELLMVKWKAVDIGSVHYRIRRVYSVCSCRRDYTHSDLHFHRLHPTGWMCISFLCWCISLSF